MSKVITYTCDRCKASDQTDKIDLIMVELHTFYRTSVVKKSEWCRRCLNEMGIDESMPEVKRIEPLPTLEDIVREIAREETNK